MRRLLTLGLVAGLLAGCTGRTAPLPIRDSLNADAGAPGDAAAGLDSGFRPDATVPPPPDAGVRPDAGFVDAGTNACTSGGFSPELTIEAGGRDGAQYSGPARVMEVEQDAVFLTYGRRQSVFVRTRAPFPDLVRPGALVWLDFGVENPWWTDAAFALREIGPADGPGELRMLVWALAPESEPFDLDDLEVDLEYGPANCVPADVDGCGPRQSLDLEYRGRGQRQVLPAGTEAAFGDVRVGNGRTYVHTSEPRCADAPFGWFEGYLTIR